MGTFSMDPWNKVESFTASLTCLLQTEEDPFCYSSGAIWKLQIKPESQRAESISNYPALEVQQNSPFTNVKINVSTSDRVQITITDKTSIFIYKLDNEDIDRIEAYDEKVLSSSC